MRGYLLDTHTLLWATYYPSRLSKPARDILVSRQEALFVSAVSAFEIGQKFRIGKLAFARSHAEAFSGEVEKDGFQLLSLGPDHARLAGVSAIDHRDPFDRMLIAQAQIEELTLISNEKVFDSFGVNRLW